MNTLSEMKFLGWFFIGLGIFIPLYTAISVAGDALTRGYEKGTLSIYMEKYPLFIDVYYAMYFVGGFFSVVGIILLLLIRKKKSRAI